MVDFIVPTLSSLFRVNLHGLVNVAAGVVDLSLGLVVLGKDPRSRVHRSFFALTVFCFIWVFSFGLMSLVESREAAKVWRSLAYTFGVTFISPAVYLFSSRWLERRDDRGVIRLGFLLAALAMIPYAFMGDAAWTLRDYEWGRYPNYRRTPFGIAAAAFHPMSWSGFSTGSIKASAAAKRKAPASASPSPKPGSKPTAARSGRNPTAKERGRA